MPLEFFINNNKNVKTKNNMNNFSLVLQATYTCVEYALYNNQELLIKQSLIKTSVCTDLMFNLCALLNNHNIAWAGIKHIIVNQGPAPFTTLRGLIATVNGISFAQKIPIIAVDGLDAFTQEVANTHDRFLILLNAFAGDFYYSLHTETEKKGCATITVLNDFISHYSSVEKPLFITGNGLSLLQNQLEATYNNHIICDTTKEYVKLETIAQCGFQAIYKKELTTFYVSPLYLKTVSYEPSCLI